MKSFLITASLLTMSLLNALTTSAQAVPGSTIDITHYQFNLSVNDDNDIIEGTALVNLRLTAPAKTVSLDFGGLRPDGKGMKVASVTSMGKEVRFVHSNNRLEIEVPASFNDHDTIGFTVRYSGIPGDGLIISKNKYQRRTFFGDNWPDRAHFWLPCKDDPSDKASVDFNITAPNHYQVISNGVQVEESGLPQGLKLTRYVETNELATKVMVIGIADFSSQLINEVRGIPVYAWVYEEDRQLALSSFSPAGSALEFLIDHVGPYPYKKLANVQSKTIYGGLENANTIFYFENAVSPAANNESLVVHEVSHQWFGNSATEQAFADLWLSEGFATYMTHLYIESKYGADSLAREMEKDRRKVIDFYARSKKPVVDAETKNYMDLLNANSYQKGSWVLHMLRNQLGDSIFWKGIRAYYSAYMGRNATTDDFRKVMEDASGQPLKQFFRQWLYTPGHPQLDIRYNYKNKELTVTVAQQQSMLFEFPLVMNIVTKDQGTLTKSVRISERMKSFTIPLTAPPEKLIADPQTNLLFEATISSGH